MATKIKCLKCEKEKSDTSANFYVNNNDLITNKKIPICKACVQDYIKNSPDNQKFDRSIELLSFLNRPFIRDLWLDVDWGDYIRQVSSLPQYKSLHFKDSDIINRNSNRSNVENTQENEDLSLEQVSPPSEFKVTPEMKKTWGNTASTEDIEYLENFYFEYFNTYSTDTPVQRNLYRNIAKIHLQAEKELGGGNIKVYKDLMELSSKLHNDGNIKPIQSTGANDDKGLSSYGLWINEVEQNEPCEFFEKKPIYEDADGFKKYLEKWFIRPFKNIFNISKDFDVED